VPPILDQETPMRDDAPMTLDQLRLFSGARQYDSFWRMSQLFPTSRLERSTHPFEWPTGASIELPDTYDHAGRARSTSQLIEDTDTVALLVLRDGEVVYEDYRLTGGPDVPWISMSVAKSFISTLVGIAVEEGHIASIDEPVSAYVPVEPGSAYDGVSIRNVLQMSSGARWNEDYTDPTSDIVQLSAAIAGTDGGSLDRFISSMVREAAPDTVCRYNSAETQVLGALVKHATGRSITDYMQEKLFEPLGVVDPGYWLIDTTGMEMAYAGLNLTARDFAKLGELFRNNGNWHGNQIISAAWVTAATTIDAPIRQPGNPIVGGHAFDLGYGYQWWIPGGERNDYSAIGVYNQYVYVDPATNVTIVKLSANPRYGLSEHDTDNRDVETIHFLRAIAQHTGSAA
jgi:CubicO group peptidase (beta-lactamase class C family)